MPETAPPSHPDVIGYDAYLAEREASEGNAPKQQVSAKREMPISTDTYQALRDIGLATDEELLGPKAPAHQYQLLNREGQDFLLSIVHDGTLDGILKIVQEAGEDNVIRVNTDLQEEALSHVMKVREGIASRRLTYAQDGSLGLDESTREIFSTPVMRRVLQNINVLKKIAARHYGDTNGADAIQ